MRILMTADTVGGVWTYALELAGALAAQSTLGDARTPAVDVVLAAMGPPPTREQADQARRIPGLELRCLPCRLEWMEDPWEELDRAGARLLALADEVGADLVHLNGYVHGALPWAIPRLVVAHSCVLTWWRAVKGEAAPPYWRRYREEVERGLAGADLVIAPTAAMLDGLRRHYRWSGKSRVIPNGRDAGRFAPGRKADILFSAGRFWDEAKNLALIDRVAPELPWPAYVAGDMAAPDGKRLEPMHARPLGRITETEMASWLARAAVYAHPARYEPFGLSPLEAGLSGCALVLGDIPSLREVWGDAAWYAPPDDADAWRDALLRLIRDPGTRAALAEAASRRARTYSAHAMAEAYRNAYGEILGRPSLAEPARGMEAW